MLMTYHFSLDLPFDQHKAKNVTFRHYRTHASNAVLTTLTMGAHLPRDQLVPILRAYNASRIILAA